MMAFVGVLGFAACEDDVDYNPAAPVDGSKTLAFFDSNAPSEVVSPYADDHFSIKVLRRGAAEAYDAAIKATVENPDLADFLDIPLSVSFAKDAMEAELKIGVNIAEGKGYPAGVPVQVVLEIADADNAYTYGPTKYTFNYQREAPFKSMGKGYYTDDVFAGLFGFPIETYEVEVEQSILNEKLYRIKNVYSKGGPFWATQIGGALAGGQGKPNAASASLEIDCTKPNEVHITPAPTGLSIDAKLFGGPEKLVPTIVGTARDMFQNAANAPLGKIENGIITFPAESIGLALQDVGGLKTNVTGKLRLVLPGAELPKPEPQCNVTYAGVFTDSKNVTSAVLNFDFNDQISACRVAVAKAADVANEAAQQKLFEQIKADEEGKISTQVTKSGRVALKVSGTGEYVAMVVAYDTESKPAMTLTCKFAIDAGNKEPVAIADFYGDYTLSGKTILGQLDKLPASPVKIEAYDESKNQVKITGLVPPIFYEQVIKAEAEGFFVAQFDPNQGGIVLATDLIYKEVDGKLQLVQWNVNAGDSKKPVVMLNAGLAFGIFDNGNGSFEFQSTVLGFDSAKNLVLQGDAQQYYPSYFEVKEQALNLKSLVLDVSDLVLTPAKAEKASAQAYSAASLLGGVFELAAAQEVKTSTNSFVRFSLGEAPSQTTILRPVFEMIQL